MRSMLLSLTACALAACMRPYHMHGSATVLHVHGWQYGVRPLTCKPN